jgi:serpin B
MAGHTTARLSHFSPLTRLLIAPAVLVACARCLPAAAGQAGRSDVVRASNAFAFDLFHQLKGQSSENSFCSPWSLSEALAMTCAGARGETRDQIARVLHFPADDDALHAGFAELRLALDSQPRAGVQLRTANRLWVQQGMDLVPSFPETLERRYGAAPGLVDFVRSSERARQTINAWVADRTEERIKDLLARSDVGPLTRLVLTNAIAFQGGWRQPFNPGWTKEAPFDVPDVGAVDVPLMTQQGRFRHADLKVCDMLEMPYADDRFAMLVLLPENAPGALNRLEQALSAETLDQWSAQLKEQSVLVSLPRFRGSSRYKLNEALAAMGMPLPFQRKADFSGITRSEPLHLSSVIHQAVVEVDEQGTKATGAAAANIEGRSLPRFFRVDRPFLFLITERTSGAILFLGRVVHPTSKL